MPTRGSGRIEPPNILSGTMPLKLAPFALDQETSRLLGKTQCWRRLWYRQWSASFGNHTIPVPAAVRKTWAIAKALHQQKKTPSSGERRGLRFDLSTNRGLVMVHQDITRQPVGDGRPIQGHPSQPSAWCWVQELERKQSRLGVSGNLSQRSQSLRQDW